MVLLNEEQEKAMPISGTWEGPGDAWDRMDVSVQVEELKRV